MNASRIARIALDEPESALAANSGFMLHEQRQALEQLENQSHFQPCNDNQGPYHVRLSLQNGYLVVDLQNSLTQPLQTLALSLRPYRRIIQDYFLMIRSYEQARLTAGPEKLEAIDMGRRGIHNEGAQMLLDRLEGKIEMDFETARKFFTLICVLHRADLSLMS
ncbi:MAG: UPF0262 family protein [Micavibrio aeruginosavorus]|uniref:UPF0262 family protein n=1 Tax=Micavibrio aeruginosavorus TaxID=349221 RepID=A0A7T5UH72_9BACT|nr:MAG: UPF0262 family protein [Micavibrio aeruginosavorus]